MNDPAAQFVDLTDQPGWHRSQVLPNQWTKSGGQNPTFWVPQTGLNVAGNGGYNSTSPGLREYYENANAQQLLPGDPKYIYQDAQLLSQGCRGGGGFCGKVAANTNFVMPGQWVHKQDYTDHDVRLEYIHPDMPWIEAVHKFQISVAPVGYTNTYNTAYFRVPARKGPGNYIAWYIWTGYYDVVDVNVQPTTVPIAKPYGLPSASLPAANTYTRIDHCELNFIHNPVTACKRVDPNTMDISACVAACSQAGGNCNAIQISRVTNVPTFVGKPPNQHQVNVPVNIPFIAWNSTQQDINGRSLGPCGFDAVNLRTRAGCQMNTSQLAPGAPQCLRTSFADTDYVCFGIQTAQAMNQSLQATPSFAFVTEPQDPRFYSSCVMKAATYGFTNFPEYPAPRPKWTAADACIPCHFLDQVNHMTTFNATIAKVPNWEKVTLSPNTCAPCY
jgi:hypothetical protein